MKIGLLFGSFNPIHTGHLIIAGFISNYLVDRVWFMVSPQNPLKLSSDLLNEDERLEMVNAAIKNEMRFKSSDVEFNLPKPSYTIYTLQKLSELYPEHTFYIIMGSDNFAGLHQWKSYKSILANFNLLVYERPGFPIENQNCPNNIQIINAPLLNISSTLIRQLIKENKSIRYLVPDEVFDIIKKKGYYLK